MPIKFDKHYPSENLKPYIKYYVVSETTAENEYKIFPSSGLVIGFQFKGSLSLIKDNSEQKLSPAGITGIADGYKVFKNSANIGTILVFFTETGFAHFTAHPIHELFNQSISLDNIFDTHAIAAIEEQLSTVHSDHQRIRVIEHFLQSQLKDIQTDKLIAEAVKLIYQSKGTIRIQELNKILLISQSPFEKRFRKVVGTTPKKFASIVRFHTVLSDLRQAKSLSEICHENNFFDQAHFIKDFKQFTGDTPENFKRLL